MKKRMVAAVLAAIMLSEGVVSYAAEGFVLNVEAVEKIEEISPSEPQEAEVEEEELNAAEKSGTLDGAIYWSVENNVLTITNHGSSRAILDYEELEHAPWYMWDNSVKEVVIGPGITGIGEYNFYHMTALKKVTIKSNELISIGEHAFDGCTNLEEILLPNTIKEIGIYAFARCKKLNKISSNGFVLPEALKEVPEYAFAECAGITNVTFPKNLQSIGACAFYSCGSLKSVEFKGNSMTIIDDYAFAKSGLESIVIPDGIQTINEYAFSECNSLKSVGILAENSLTYIGTGVFEGCSNLTGFYVMAESYAAAYGAAQKELAGICVTYKYMGNDRKENYKIQISGDTSYTGKEIKPKVSVTLGGTELQEGVDYILSFSNNIEVGSSAKVTIKGINGYYGSMDEYFSITAFDITKKGKISSIKQQVYTGKAIKPDVVVSVNGVTLTKNKDYTVSYKNNVNVGKNAKVIVKGKGKYKGTIEKSFIIAADLKGAKVTVKKQTYTGKKLKPSVTVVLNGKKLTKGTDYKVTYSNNKKVGKNGKVTITGAGLYSGKITKKFTIAPQKPKVKLDGKKLKITNYQSGADIYITYTANVNGSKKQGKLLWQAKKYKAEKCVDLSQLVKKYKNGDLSVTVTMKVNGVESGASKKVSVE